MKQLHKVQNWHPKSTKGAQRLLPILKIERYLLEINKQILMYVWSGWIGGCGVFLPEEEYQKESMPPQSGNPPCSGVRQIKSGKCPNHPGEHYLSLAPRFRNQKGL